jgi:hypothetical protein
VFFLLPGWNLPGWWITWTHCARTGHSATRYATVSYHWALEKDTSCPLDFDHSTLQSFANCGIPGSTAFPLRPNNVAENLTPQSLPPALHGQHGHIHNSIPEATSTDEGLIHGTRTVGLREMPRHVPGSRLRRTVTYTSLPGIL